MGSLRLSKNCVIPSQCAHYSAPRAAYGGCALYAPAGAVAWESPKSLNFFLQ